MPQDPPERVDVVARRPGLPVSRPRRERWRMHAPASRTDAPRPLSRLQAVRRLLEEHPHRDGEKGGDQDTVGDGHRGVRRRERRTCQHTGRLPG